VLKTVISFLFGAQFSSPVADCFAASWLCHLLHFVRSNYNRTGSVNTITILFINEENGFIADRRKIKFYLISSCHHYQYFSKGK